MKELFKRSHFFYVAIFLALEFWGIEKKIRLWWKDLGSMFWSQFSAIFANFLRKNWPFFSKTNILITIFCDFRQSSAKKIGIHLKNQCYDQILA
jgi:hypothetical protein